MKYSMPQHDHETLSLKVKVSLSFYKRSKKNTKTPRREKYEYFLNFLISVPLGPKATKAGSFSVYKPIFVRFIRIMVPREGRLNEKLSGGQDLLKLILSLS